MRRIKTIKTKVFIAVTFSLLLVGLISSLLKFSTALVVAQGGGSPQNVVWTNVVNATATGNTLQKTSGCDGCPDAGATSQQTITSGDGYMEFTVGTVTGQRFAGLSNDNPGTGWQEIDFAFRLWGVAASGNLDVQENGTYRYLGATYVAGDVLRVAVESGAVKYYKNGVLLYTSTVAPVYPLQVDTSLLDANSAVNNAVISTAFPGGSGNQISNINVAVNCNTSALINFSTSAASRAFVEYGPTTSYGSSTIDDPVRFYTEHAIQLTGLSANTTYHYRITANSNGITQSSDQSFTTASSGATCTALPAQVDSRMPDMTGAVERTIKTSGGHYTPSQFQTALNDAGTASEKRIITVDAGLTLSGQWTLPANADQNWIVIRTSQHAQLPEGKRVAPADASKLFKIQNTSVDPTLLAAAAANHIRIIGAEITIDPSALGDAPGGANQAGLIQLYTNLANNASNIPKFIGFDRCYVHGLPTKNTGRGLHATWEDSFVIDSYFDEFHFSGADGQAILFLDAKRNKILNNTLIGVGENFMWGGDALRIDNYVIGQLEFLRNHLYVPCKWKPDGGCGDTFTTDWTAEKNLFECKTCAKLFVFGNYLGGTTDAQGGFWPDGQSLAINLKLEQNSGRVSSVTVTNGGSGYTSPPTVSFTHVPGCVHGNCVQATATVSGGQVTNVNITSGKNGLGYCLAPTVSFSGGGGTGAAATANIAGALELMEDIVWYKNFMKNVHAGTAVVGHTITGAGNCGITPDRVLFKDNLFEIDDVVWDPEPGASSGTWGATGWFLGGTQNLQIIHNTIINANAPQASSCGSLFNDGSLILVGDPVTPKWTGFVFKDNVIDYRGCGISGSGAINHANNALANQFTGFVVTNNGIMRTGGEASNWPGVQLWATSWTSRLLNFNSGRDGNYRLANGTAWKNAAGDGKDLGADVDGVEGATANAPTGNWPSP